MESNPPKTTDKIIKEVKNTPIKEIKYKIIKRKKKSLDNNTIVINNNLDCGTEKKTNKLINKDINELYNIFNNKIQDNNIINAFKKVLFGRITQISNNIDYYKIKLTDNKNKIILYYYMRGLLLILHKTLLNYIEFNQEDKIKMLMLLQNLKENYCNNIENNNKNKVNKLCSLCHINILEQPILNICCNCKENKQDNK